MSTRFLMARRCIFQRMPKRPATIKKRSRSASMRRPLSVRWKATRMKNRPVPMSSNCWASVISAPDSKRAADTAATMPGRLSHDSGRCRVSIADVRIERELRSIKVAVSSILSHQFPVRLHPGDGILETPEGIKVEADRTVNTRPQLLDVGAQETLWPCGAQQLSNRDTVFGHHTGGRAHPADGGESQQRLHAGGAG